MSIKLRKKHITNADLIDICADLDIISRKISTMSVEVEKLYQKSAGGLKLRQGCSEDEIKDCLNKQCQELSNLFQEVSKGSIAIELKVTIF